VKGSKATVREVAKAAGLSTATVSRVLNGDSPQASGSSPRVSEEARGRVLAAAASLGYKANHVARSLKTRSTRTIAVLAPELRNDFFMELAQAMERELGAAGYMLLISSSSNSADEEERRLGMLSERLVDGVVVIPAASRGDHIQRAAELGMPIVLVDRLVEGACLDAVLADNEGGAFAAASALLADGYRELAFVGGEISLTTACERLAGFRRALAGRALEAGPASLRLGGMDIEAGWRHMDAILAEAEPPEALFAVNLLVHLGIERRLLEAGAKALERFAVASFDETPYSPFMPACRYAVAQPAAAMGAAAARLVLERIAEHRLGDAERRLAGAARAIAAPRVIRLPTELIRHPRGS
jgi:LacI family transcriptional regulator